MDSHDQIYGEALLLESLSSRGFDTPEKSDHARELSKVQVVVQDFLESSTKKELVHAGAIKENTISGSSKGMAKSVGTDRCKKQENGKNSIPLISNKHQTVLKKPQRKGDNPARLSTMEDVSSDVSANSSWVCKNSACRATLSLEDTFCKRCSCCICHMFDDNKDPSLWFFCSSESNGRDSCGLSCHIECALQHKKAGVVDLGQLIQLDGNYCCPSCGKVSGIIGSWKKQLVIAKDARRVDVYCYRISLSHRLLDGTSRFKDLHDIVSDAKRKLEAEVGSINGMSARMGRGIVSRLSVAADIQNLCALAIEKGETWLSSTSHSHPSLREDSIPAACRIQFEDITSSSLVVILKDPSSGSSDDVQGYKLWYYKSRERTHPKESVCILPKSQRRILISNLQPCTEYTIKMISFTESGDLGHSESKCFTKSVEIIHKSSDIAAASEKKSDSLDIAGGSTSLKRGSRNTSASSVFKVRDLGKILRVAWAHEQGYCDEFGGVDDIDGIGLMQQEPAKESTHIHSRNLDLNVICVPDLNADLTPESEFSREEGISEHPVEGEDDVHYSHGRVKNSWETSNGGGDDSHWSVRPLQGAPLDELEMRCHNKQLANGIDEPYDCDSTLINGSPLRFSSASGCLDENYEYCVKVVRSLEQQGHIEKDFRMRFLTWFSLRSNEQERKVVNTYIQSLNDDANSLAGQLVDSFFEIISNKRARNGFCSKLWH